MSNPNYSEILSTTLDYYDKTLADNIGKNIPLLKRLNSRGNVKTVSGGRKILQPLHFAENANFLRYSGYDTLSYTPGDVITSAEYDWKQAAVGITISGLEDLQNDSEEQVFDLLEARVDNASITLENNIDADMYSDGTADTGKQIGGLQYLVSDTPAVGACGGIDPATDAYWENKMFDANADGGAATSDQNIQLYMTSLWTQLVRNNDRPDLMVFSEDYWTFYHNSLTAIQRITDQNTDMAKGGFQSLKFMDADVLLASPNCPAEHGYMLNTRYIFFRPHSRRNFVKIGDDRVPKDQDASIQYIGFAGNMTVSARNLQGVLIDTTA